MDGAADAWFDRELAGCSFADDRLNKRLRRLLKRTEGAMGASIPLACQGWASTKAAYRLFSDDRVSEEKILAGHFQATQTRFAATSGPILVLQDTTEFMSNESGRTQSATRPESTAARTAELLDCVVAGMHGKVGDQLPIDPWPMLRLLAFLGAQDHEIKRRVAHLFADGADLSLT